MDELELVRHMKEASVPPTPAAVARARNALRQAAAASGSSGRAWRLGPNLRQGLRTVVFLAGVSTAAIMVEPHNPIQLPGHRALGWLGLLFMMRLVGGTGWATAVGLASAIGTVAIGRSPNGSFWGVLQYVVAGLGVDAFLAARPRIATSPLRLAILGAGLLMLVGWITPISNSFVGGATPRDIWVSLTSIHAAGWLRLLGFDAAFGAGAGAIGYGLAWAVAWVCQPSRVVARGAAG